MPQQQMFKAKIKTIQTNVHTYIKIKIKIYKNRALCDNDCLNKYINTYIFIY